MNRKRGRIGQFLMYATAWALAIAFWAAILQSRIPQVHLPETESTQSALNVAAAAPNPISSVSAQPIARLNTHPPSRHAAHAPARAEDGFASLEGELSQLRKEIAGTPLPTVAVCIPGTCDGVNTPAAQAAMIALLNKAGFKVLDLEAIVEAEYNRWWPRLLEEGPRPAVTPEVALGYAANGELMRNRYTSRILSATDYLIIGQASSSNVHNHSSSENEQAVVEATVLAAPSEGIVTTLLQRADTAAPLALGEETCRLTETSARCALATARAIAEHWQASQPTRP